MQSLVRKATRSTPHVNFDLNTGVFVMAGRCIPEDAEVFFRPILDWLEDLGKSATPRRISMFFHFDFFNIASSKRILFMMYKFVQLQELGSKVTINWGYDNQDEDMLEIGKDYASMIPALHFSFDKVNIPKKVTAKADI
jgi:hypothetical protein